MGTYIIAEAGVNHNGSVELAKKLVDVAVSAGADAIKFQTFKTEKLVVENAVKADYQLKTTSIHQSQYEMLKDLELSNIEFMKIHEYCQKKSIQFLSTPFDSESLIFLINKFDLPFIKLSSGDVNNAPFLLQVAQMGKAVVLSTGMSSLADVEMALSVLAFGYSNNGDPEESSCFCDAYCSAEGQLALQMNVKLLHCTSEYPTRFVEANLRVIDTLAQAFSLPVGYSDHTEGIEASLAAVARGACIIEKHFTLDKCLPGPDHRASLSPNELENMIKSVRNIEAALGDGTKKLERGELDNLVPARKSLRASGKIMVGELLAKENITVMRPGDGLSPFDYWKALGTKADREYQPGDKIVIGSKKNGS